MNDYIIWFIQFTPALGVVCVILLIVLVNEPARGGVDGAETLKVDSWFNDVREVCKVFVKNLFSI